MKSKCLLFILSFMVMCLGTGCSSRVFSEKSVAPYRHVIQPIENHFQEQEKIFEKLLVTNPKSFQTAASLASLYAAEAKQTGDLARFDQAEKLALKSRALFPIYNDHAYLVLADVNQARHQFKEAIKLCDDVIQDSTAKRGAKMAALSILITSKLATGELEDALKSADRLVDMDPSLASYTLRALVLEPMGRDEEALFDYQMAYQKEGFGFPAESAKLRAFWGRFYARRGEYAKAEGLWREALRIVPSDALVTGYLAELEFEEGKYEVSDQDYQKAFDRSHQTLYLLGQIEAKRALNQVAQANELQTQVEKLLRKPLESGPALERYAHRNELVKLLLGRGNPADLKEALKLAEEEVSNRRNSETLFLSAQASARLNDLPRAQEFMQELLRSGVKQADYFVFAGQLEERLKQTSRARFYFKRAQETNPHYQLENHLMNGASNRVAAQ